MDWKTLLQSRRERSSIAANPGDIRTEFRKDYHRIIGSASFRRLQDKAQVYPLTRGDFVRTRLTHSLEVSSFAGSLADMIFRRLIDIGTPDVCDIVRENCRDILECAGLIHDIGNPPFGHFGEFAIRQWFKENLPKLSFAGTTLDKLLDNHMKADFLNFEGNAQALRVLARLHCLIDMNTGMNLTYALLHTIVKYPVSSLEIDKLSGDIRTKKMGFFLSEQELFYDIAKSTGTNGKRFPLTFILESADDIAYKTADIEDAVIKGLLSYDVLLKELQSEKYASESTTEAYRELIRSHDSAEKLHMENADSAAVSRWIIKLQTKMLYAATDAFCDNYNSIMAGDFKEDLLSASPAGTLSDALSDIAYRYAFRSGLIVKNEVSEWAVMNGLLEKTVNATLRFGTPEQQMIDRDLTEILSDNYREICLRNCEGKTPAEQAYYRLLYATDCISGMTDSFAVEFFHTLNG